MTKNVVAKSWGLAVFGGRRYSTNVEPEESSFDYYIGPSGSDSNDGLTTGTPWAITAINTKRATYSPSGVGKTIGLMDGTYNIASLMTTSRDVPALDIEGGTVDNEVIIKAVNPRMAIITAKNGSTYGNATNTVNAMIGHTVARRQGYIVLDGLKITGGRTTMVEFGTYAVSSNVPGLVVQNCELYDQSDVGSSPGGGNAAAIVFNTGCDGYLVDNTYIHDIVGHNGTTSADHLSAILSWQSQDGIIRKCTIINAGPLRGKEDNQGGVLIEQTYIDSTAYTAESVCIYDFVSPPTPSASGNIIIRNCVLLGGQVLHLIPEVAPTSAPSENIKVYNCTIGISDFAAAGGIAAQGDTASNSFYNNIFFLIGIANPSDLGFTLIKDGSLAVMDYNIYPSSNQKWSWYTTDPGSRSGTTSLATAKSHYGSDANSPAPTNTPGFVATGSLAAYYNVLSGAAYQAGRTGGTSGGSVVNIGIEANIQVGCNF